MQIRSGRNGFAGNHAKLCNNLCEFFDSARTSHGRGFRGFNARDSPNVFTNEFTEIGEQINFRALVSYVNFLWKSSFHGKRARYFCGLCKLKENWWSVIQFFKIIVFGRIIFFDYYTSWFEWKFSKWKIEISKFLNSINQIWIYFDSWKN